MKKIIDSIPVEVFESAVEKVERKELLEMLQKFPVSYKIYESVLSELNIEGLKNMLNLFNIWWSPENQKANKEEREFWIEERKKSKIELLNKLQKFKVYYKLNESDYKKMNVYNLQQTLIKFQMLRKKWK